MLIYQDPPRKEGLPLIVTPAKAVSFAQFKESLRQERETLDEQLIQHGALLFKGFPIAGEKAFQEAAECITPELLDYNGGNSPRSAVSGKVYTSTEFAADSPISLHNESSYLKKMPAHIFFFCDRAPASGGQTVLASCRLISKQLNPEIREQFAAKGICYENHLHDGFGFGRSWQDTFLSDDRETVEQRLVADGYRFQWREDGGLKTSLSCPALRQHPVSGEWLWTNQAEQWHPSSLNSATREAIQALYPDGDLPHNATFGDGSPLDEAHLNHIRTVMNEAEVAFDWQEGDMLVCDNYLIAHGRRPFQGKRRILVAMG